MPKTWQVLFAALFAMGSTACDDEPTCTVLSAVGGPMSAPIDWNLAGEANCARADVSVINPDATALSFIAREDDRYQQIVVLIESPSLGVAEFPAEVLFITPDNLWDSGPSACTAVITDYTVEPWSKIDFVQVEGIVNCPDPLVSAAGTAALTLEGTGFKGHLLDLDLDVQNL